jgi:hypothetical protein
LERSKELLETQATMKPKDELGNEEPRDSSGLEDDGGAWSDRRLH